jgi:hypothetical protein
VVRFLEAILPELDEIEALLPKETAP